MKNKTAPIKKKLDGLFAFRVNDDLLGRAKDLGIDLPKLFRESLIKAINSIQKKGK